MRRGWAPVKVPISGEPLQNVSKRKGMPPYNSHLTLCMHYDKQRSKSHLPTPSTAEEGADPTKKLGVKTEVELAINVCPVAKSSSSSNKNIV